MSAVGYSEIIEYIASEVVAYSNAADEIEQDVDRYMESLTQAVQERAEQMGKEQSWNVVDGTFTSVWDDGESVETPCRANVVTRLVETDAVESNGNVLEREFVTIDGKEYPAVFHEDREGFSDEEQKGMFFYR